jgi:hypothetical protein
MATIAKNLDFDLQAVDDVDAPGNDAASAGRNTEGLMSESPSEVADNDDESVSTGAAATPTGASLSSSGGGAARESSETVVSADGVPGVRRKLIRVICRVKKTDPGVQSCIKEMTNDAVHIWSVSNGANLAMASQSSKKRKHNTTADLTTAANAYSFDRVYGGNTTQQTFYDSEVKECVTNLLQGSDTTIFAYGNTNSGKSYTIFGQPKSLNRKTTDGVLFRVVKDIFSKQTAEGGEMSLKISAFEIYNEKVYDLLCRVRPTASRGVG